MASIFNFWHILTFFIPKEDQSIQYVSEGQVPLWREQYFSACITLYVEEIHAWVNDTYYYKNLSLPSRCQEMQTSWWDWSRTAILTVLTNGADVVTVGHWCAALAVIIILSYVWMNHGSRLQNQLSTSQIAVYFTNFITVIKYLRLYVTSD